MFMEAGHELDALLEQAREKGLPRGHRAARSMGKEHPMTEGGVRSPRNILSLQ